MLGAVDVFLLAVAFTSDVYQSETNRRRHFVDVFLPPPNRNRQERLSTLTQKRNQRLVYSDGTFREALPIKTRLWTLIRLKTDH